MKRFILLIFIISISIYSQKKNYTEKEKIDLLLSKVENLNAKFFRNGQEYSPKEAVEHMKKKLDYAGDRVKTANDFIEGIASKSYFTGSPYLIILPDGKKIESGIWLKAELKKIESK
ncbi:MAG: DUF5329 family protein [Leptospiraceae bacterium]|nr:DUF5329 family protein [Leptospiraceae bacterium]